MHTKSKNFFFLVIGLLILLSSCKVIAPNRMFKQGEYQYFSVGKEVIDQYTIQNGDLLTLQIYSREGFQLIDVLPNETGGGSNVSGNQGSGGSSNSTSMTTNVISYLVEQDGFVELPLFGRTYVKGLTENQLEDLIESKCSAIFVEPYAILKVVNRRAFVFMGSNAAVISLNQGPTSLIEVITKAGGVGTDLKAHKIKIIRGNLSNPEIISVDLSTIQGLQNANLIVQTNDIIYVEQRIRYASLAFREITPFISAIGTVATLTLLIKR